VVGAWVWWRAGVRAACELLERWLPPAMQGGAACWRLERWILLHAACVEGRASQRASGWHGGVHVACVARARVQLFIFANMCERQGVACAHWRAQLQGTAASRTRRARGSLDENQDVFVAKPLVFQGGCYKCVPAPPWGRGGCCQCRGHPELAAIGCAGATCACGMGGGCARPARSHMHMLVFICFHALLQPCATHRLRIYPQPNIHKTGKCAFPLIVKRIDLSSWQVAKAQQSTMGQTLAAGTCTASWA